MEFDTVRTGLSGRWYVTTNGVTSAAFVEFRKRDKGGGEWTVMVPRIAHVTDTLDEALEIIASGMDTWYTATEAAAHLVEIGVFDGPPSAQRVTKWCRDGLLPGAFKLLGRGARGSGGSWRLPEAALVKFAERRRRE